MPHPDDKTIVELDPQGRQKGFFPSTTVQQITVESTEGDESVEELHPDYSPRISKAIED